MHDEDGFTLIEMIITVMLMGIIVSTVAGALYIMFTTTNETTQRLSESPDLQIAAAYFGSDVQSAQSFSLPTGVSCGPASPLLTLYWKDPGNLPAAGAEDTDRTVVYAVQTVGVQNQLVRHYCASGTADSTTLVNFLKPATAPTPECRTAADSSTACGSSTRTVRLPNIVICTANASAACQDDELTFELKATRRAG